MHRDKSERRIDHAALLGAIVDQFISRQMHPVADIKQFERLALGLIDIVDAPAAARIARPLCVHPETPPSIFRCLLAKGGPCAELALQFAPALPRAELMSAAQGGASILARAVARRGELGREIVEALIQRGEPEISRALAANLSLRLDAGARRALALAARDDLALARLLLDRDDFNGEAEGLFLAATRHERTEIILDACRRALSAGKVERRPADQRLTALLEAAALQNDRAAMAAILAEALDCRVERALAILADAQGEPLALALAALGVDPDTASRVFLGVAEEANRAPMLAALVRAVPQRAALQIIAAISGGAQGEREAVRRARDEQPAPPGWRRAAPAVGPAPLRKVDRSA